MCVHVSNLAEPAAAVAAVMGGTRCDGGSWEPVATGLEPTPRRTTAATVSFEFGGTRRMVAGAVGEGTHLKLE